MGTPPAASSPHHRIVFVTRDPVVHEQSGSTTYIHGLLHLLVAHGAQVTLVATTAYSRSPRLFFRVVSPLPVGVMLHVPGYARLGSFFVRPISPKAWARALVRFAIRHPRLRPLGRACERLYGCALYTAAWDLTAPTAAEAERALQAVEAAKATAVIANYCLWGPLLRDPRLGDRRSALLMHDLLSARSQRFAESGTPMDMPPITEAEEMHMLGGAQTVLAAQEREAAVARAYVPGRVLVTPVVLHPRALEPAAVIPGRCLFVGSNIAPNRTGLAFLLESVWPRVRQAVPGATLAIAGTVGLTLTADAPAGLSSLGVEIIGKVPTLEAEYARAAVCLVPLLLGTGIKIKLLEGLGFGKAIVSTSTGIEGLEASATEAVCVADDPESFTAAIIRLLTDDYLRRQHEAAALTFASKHFGPARQLDPAFVSALL